MNEGTKQSKIDRFLRDEVMSNAVYESIRDTYLKRKGVQDVTYLAAERIALDLLAEAWKDLLKYKIGDEVETKQRINHL